MKSESITVNYSPNRYTKLGKKALLKEMFCELTESFELGNRLFIRDLSAKYRQSVLGVLWIVLAPFYATVVFFGLKMAGILSVGETDVPYPLYVLVGTTIWSLLAGLITSLSLSVNASVSLLGKINFPRIALVHSPILTSFMDFLIRLVLVIVGMSFFGFFPSLPGLVLLPITLLPLIFLSVGIGLFLSLIGAVIKDVGNATMMMLNLLLYMIPILYPMPKTGTLRVLSMYNPLYVFVAVPRDLLFYGTADGLSLYLLYSLITIPIFLSGWRFYYIALSRIVEKV